MKDEFDRLEIVSPPSRVVLEGYYKLMGRGYPLEDESEDESMDDWADDSEDDLGDEMEDDSDYEFEREGRGEGVVAFASGAD